MNRWLNAETGVVKTSRAIYWEIYDPLGIHHIIFMCNGNCLRYSFGHRLTSWPKDETLCDSPQF